MNHFPKKFIALAATFAVITQGVVPPAALAFDETLPGGTSPSITSPPGGKQQPPPNWWSALLEKVKNALDPVDVHLGDFVLTRQDVFLPGRLVSVDITFTYRSRSAYNGSFGYGWDMSYNRRVRKLSNGNLLVLRGNNRKDEFTFTAPSTYTPPSGVYDTLVQNANGTYLLTSKHGDKEFYDLNGNLTRMEDRNGNAITFTYDPAGLLPITGKSDYFVNQTTGVIAREYQLTRITDTAGRAITFTYNADGRLSTIAYQGRTLRYDYDTTGTGDLLSVTDPLGNVTRYTYSKHNLTAITDPKGQMYLTNVYDDATDRVTSQTYGIGTSTISYGKDAGGNLTSDVTDRRGFKTQFTFDAAGHVIKQEEFTDGNPVGEPASYVTQYEYNAAGERTRILLPKGNSTEFTYDAKGNLLEIRRKKIGAAKGVADPSDIVTTFTYEPQFNFVKTATDPLGHVTTYTYDYELGEPAKGNVRKIAFAPVGGQTPQVVFTYNAFGQVETVTDPNGNVTKNLYDATTGYLTQVIRGFGTADVSTSTLAYDSFGNITSATNANGQTTTFEHNALNQLVKTTSPVPFNFATYFTYDANGNVIQTDRQAKTGTPGPRPVTGTVSATDDWQSTAFTDTTLDQVASVTDDLGNKTTFTYDANGNRILVQDAKLNTTTSEYDDRNLLLKATDPNGSVTLSSYDLNGNLASIKDANGNLTSYSYDDFDRLTRLTYPDGSFENSSYDAASNVTSRVTPAGQTITSTYDVLNRLTTKVTPQETTTYTYDPGSRLTNVTDADAALAYAYDALNRATQVTTIPTGLSATTVRYAYDKLGLRTKLTYPDGSFITYGYDELSRLTEIKDSTNLKLAGYTYDALSRRSAVTLANGVSTSYQYDAVSRLLSLTPQSTTLNVLAFSYTYDALGNRLTMATKAAKGNKTVSQTYTYDALSQLTTVDYPTGYAFADTTFSLDLVGNRTQMTVGASTTSYTPNNLNQYTVAGGSTLTYDLNGNLKNDGTNNYTYDAENRLIQASTGSGTVTYTYDPLGRRLSKTVNGVATRFLYDGDEVIAETDSGATITAKYIFGPGLDEPLRMEKAGNSYYYHFDGLGSVAGLTDAGGQLKESYAYDVYGQFKITDPAGNPLTQSTVGNRFTFTGREFDSETGHYSYRARVYNPKLGRFLQRDPVGTSAGLNLYTYVDNNPANFADPLGLDKNFHRYSLDDFLLDASNFSAGLGDMLSFGATDWIRGRWGLNDYVNKSSGLYRAGEVAGFGAGLAAGGVGSLNAGGRTVLYSGRGALQAAQAGKGAGRILEETLGGRVLNWVDDTIQAVGGTGLPQAVWKAASAIFAGNAKGEVQIFLRNPSARGIYNAVERPVLDFFKNTVRVFK